MSDIEPLNIDKKNIDPCQISKRKKDEDQNFFYEKKSTKYYYPTQHNYDEKNFFIKNKCCFTANRLTQPQHQE